jgi:N-acetyl-gamma-glutamyl-phosphate reductase
LYRAELVGAKAIAVPGCNPTAACLALAPFTRGNVVSRSGLIVDLAAGVSGAGRGPKAHTQFCAVDENFEAYGLLTHRHTPEMEQVLDASLLFTPHLAPMSRGILATCYATPHRPMSSDEALAVMAEFYADEPFIVVDERSPSTKATMGSNTVHMTARVDPRTGYLIAIAAIDNLTKGSAGGAIQSINVALGLAEDAGLPKIGLLP